jgi:hypothetical protein
VPLFRQASALARWPAIVAATMAVTSAAQAGPEQKLYEEARFKECVQSVERSVLEQAEEQRADAYLYLARCHEAQGNRSQVERALSLALASDPLAALDATSDKPSLLALLETLRRQASGRLSITVANRTPAAFVLIDGELLPFPATDKTVGIGQHRVQLVDATGKELASRAPVVRQNQTVVVEMEMPKEVTSMPSAEAAPTPVEAFAAAPSPPAVGNGSLLLRADSRIDLSGIGRSAVFSFGVGPALAVSWFRAQASVLLAAQLGAQLRAGGAIRLSPPLTLVATVDAAVWAFELPRGDVGATVEVEWNPIRKTTFYAGTTVKWAPTPPPGFRDWYVLAHVGAAFGFLQW